MKKKMTLLVLAMTATLPSVALSTITGTTSVEATFTSTIEAGTCNAEIQDAGGAPISILPFGDVFKSDLVSKNRRGAFKIAFTNCAGVKNAAIQATPRQAGRVPVMLKMEPRMPPGITSVLKSGKALSTQAPC